MKDGGEALLSLEMSMMTNNIYYVLMRIIGSVSFVTPFFIFLTRVILLVNKSAMQDQLIRVMPLQCKISPKHTVTPYLLKGKC